MSTTPPTAPEDAPREVLDEPPSIGGLAARALVQSRGGPGDGPLPATVVEQHGVTVDPGRLAAYGEVCGFRLRDELPATYPYVLAFPLSVHLMARDDFPLPLLGLVHVDQRIVVHQPLTTADRFDLAVWVADRRPHHRGEQFDVHATAAIDGAVVWSSSSTYLHRGPARADAPPAPSRATDEVDVATLGTTATWRVPADTGRRYGAVSGDRNPIHLTTATARLFGLDRPIAHGMWSLARCLAALEGRVPATPTIEAGFGARLPLPSTVRYRSGRRGGDWHLALEVADGHARPHLTAVVSRTP